MLRTVFKQKEQLFYTQPATPLSKRVSSIDMVRGLVMIIMALDHVRDLLHRSSLTQSPTDLNTTTTLLFFSRWVTHLCAPTFVLLSGVSAWLYYQNHPDKSAARNRLWKRGLWLIVLEFTLVNFTLWFDVEFRLLMMQVIAAIGVGLILISAVVKIKPLTLGMIAIVIICSHNLLQSFPQPSSPVLRVALNVFFRPGILQPSEHFMFFVAYPLIPWVAILLLGFSIGPLFQAEALKQKRFLVFGALAALGLFTVLRLVNMYGDPAPWSTQKNGWYTFLSFLNVTKYPPSLLFVSLFIGIACLLLRFCERFPQEFQRIVSVFGQVPLFYYLLHLCFIRLAVFIMVFAQGFRWRDLLFGPFQFGRPAQGSGISLGAVFLVWITIVALLYPLCKWYGKYKKRYYREKPWLQYL
jgi:uncharacterized membrane protein